MRDRWLSYAFAVAMLMGVPAHAREFDELAVDEPLQVGEKRNVWPRDLLVVDRNYDLWADPRVRVVDTTGTLDADGESQWLINARTRAVVRPLVPKNIPTATAPSTRPASTQSSKK